MDLPFTYVVTASDPDANYMRVAYSSPGKSTIEVGLRYPFDGEDPVTFIEDNAPQFHWELEGKAHVKVDVGFSGTRAARPPRVQTPTQTVQMERVVV
jgi:hypothetical protein